MSRPRPYVGFSGYFGPHSPHVFAAAPELLAALREIETICTESPAALRKRMGTRVGNVLTTALAAIAKAEGTPTPNSTTLLSAVSAKGE